MFRIINGFLPKSKFARGVGLLLTGTAGSQLLLVITAPLLTRLYSPEDFGMLAVYAGLLALLTVVASMRYELAIVLPESNDDAINVLALSLGIVTLISVLAGGVVFFKGDSIAGMIGAPSLAAYMWLLPIGMFLSGSFHVLSKWAIREKKFSIIASTRISQTLSMLFVQLAFFKVGGGALLFGQTASQGVGSLKLLRKSFTKDLFGSVKWPAIKKMALRYRKFPIYDTWYGLFFTAGQQLPPLMFAALFGGATAGLYALAHRVLAMPMAVIGGAIGNVFFSDAAEAYREGRLGPLFVNVFDKLAQIAMPPNLILIIAGPELFVIAFGEEWHKAGEFARYMSVWLIMQFIAAPLTTLFTVLEKQKHGAVFQFFMLSIRFGAILLGASMDSITLAIVLFSGGSAFCYAAMILWMAIKCESGIALVFMSMLRAALSSTFIVLPLLGSVYLINERYALFVGLAITGCLVLGRYYQLIKPAYKTTA